jgi:type IV pilus assembly protein PilV
MLKPIHGSTSQGFTLIEVLIAVIVLAIGLLGLANLQTLSLRNSQSTYLRTQANILAYDIVDRMRSNLGLSDTNNDGLPNDYSDNYSKMVGRSVPDCTTVTGCSTFDMVNQDLYEWNAIISKTLPGGKGTVCIDDTPATPDCTCVDRNPILPGCQGGTTYVVRIEWDDNRTGVANQSLVVAFRPAI